MIGLFATAFAAPPAVAVGATGGYDYPTSQWFGGAEVSLLARNTKGFQPIGRFIGAWGSNGHPLLSLEAGGLFVVPHDEALIRLGAIMRPAFTVSPGVLPFQLSDPHEGASPGFILGGQLWLEFEWGDLAPLTVGVKAGVNQFASDYSCEQVDPDFASCRTWEVGAIGSFFVRKTFAGGFSLQLEAGTIPTISIRQVLNPRRAGR